MSEIISLAEWAENMMGGYTEEELSAAFDLVKNPENWKLPIVAVVRPMDGPVDEAHRDLITRAVTFHTGSVPTFEPIHDHETGEPNGSFLVEATGYYAEIGA